MAAFNFAVVALDKAAAVNFGGIDVNQVWILLGFKALQYDGATNPTPSFIFVKEGVNKNLDQFTSEDKDFRAVSLKSCFVLGQDETVNDVLNDGSFAVGVRKLGAKTLGDVVAWIENFQAPGRVRFRKSKFVVVKNDKLGRAYKHRPMVADWA